MKGLPDAMIRMGELACGTGNPPVERIAKMRRGYDWDVKVNGMLGYSELAALQRNAR